MPEVDEEILYLFRWFHEVKGGEPLTYQEIENWNKLKCYDITPDEVAVLMKLDTDFYNSQIDGNQ